MILALTKYYYFSKWAETRRPGQFSHIWKLYMFGKYFKKASVYRFDINPTTYLLSGEGKQELFENNIDFSSASFRISNQHIMLLHACTHKILNS